MESAGEKIAKDKDLYYEALRQSQTGWHEGSDDPVPFIKYLLGTILAAYKDFDERFALVETKLSALEMVRRASQLMVGRGQREEGRAVPVGVQMEVITPHLPLQVYMQNLSRLYIRQRKRNRLSGSLFHVLFILCFFYLF